MYKLEARVHNIRENLSLLYYELLLEVYLPYCAGYRSSVGAQTCAIKLAMPGT